MSKRSSTSYPLPEIVVPQEIKVRSGRGSMDNTAMVMSVPLTGTPAGRHVRAHEMAHAMWSPPNPKAYKGIDQAHLQTIEDMRMNVLCLKAGLDDAMNASVVEESTDKPIPFYAKADVSRYLCATWNTGDQRFVEDSIKSNREFFKAGSPRPKRDSYGRAYFEDQRAYEYKITLRDYKEALEFCENAWEELSESPTFETTLRLAQRAEELFGKRDNTYDDAGMAIIDGGWLPSDAEPNFVSPWVDDGTKLNIDKLLERYSSPEYEKEAKSEEYVVSGELKIQYPPLLQKMNRPRTANKKPPPAEMGRVPKYINRYCFDRAIFSDHPKPRKSKGGTLLVDLSGSMRLSDSDIDEVLEIAPAATIAAYSGENSYGELWVLATKGRRISKEGIGPPYGGNVVDLPSLQWLAKQRGPRHWISDAHVTGIGDRASYTLAKDCLLIAKNNQIRRHHSVNHLMSYLKAIR